MKHKLYLLFLVLSLSFSLSGPLFGSDVSVDYLEGSLSYRADSGQWVKVGIGDNLFLDSTVRLSEKGFAELTAGESKITLTRDGIYNVNDLFGKKLEKTGFRQMLGNKFSFLLNRSDSANYTAAAVRGSSRNSDFLTWEDDEESNLKKGIKLYNEGNYVAARNQFKEGSLWEKGSEKRENLFRLSMTENRLGNPRESRHVLASLEPKTTDPFFEEYSLHAASLYIESQDYEMAEDLLQVYLNSKPSKDGKQAALLLVSYAYEGQGKKLSSRKALEQLISLDSNSDIAKSANLLLK